MDTKQSAPQVSDSALRLPGEPPELPPEVLDRFPSLGTWMDQQRTFWSSAQNAMQDFAQAVLDVQTIGNVLYVDGDAGSLYVKNGRGEGAYADPDTPFYVDSTGRFSLKNLLTWNPDSAELTVEGTIIADAGEIGGWIISPTTLSKNNAVLDSAGQLALGTGNDIIIISATDATYRIWAGNATAGTATFSVTKTGALFSTAGTIGGFSIGTDYLRDTANSFGMAATVTGGDDVRFWAGDTFANRTTAPFRVYESGIVVATSGTIGGFTLGADYIRDTANSFGLASTVTGGNDVRFWAGDTFANRATAPLRFYEDGTGFIAGFTIESTRLKAGSGATLIQLNSTGSVLVGDPTASVVSAILSPGSVQVNNTAGDAVASMGIVAGDGIIVVYDSTLVQSVVISGSTGAVVATGTITANLFSGSGASLTSLNASNLASGTVPDARFPATLPAVSGANLTNLNASNIASGTLNNARLPSAISVTSVTASGEIRGATARFGTFTAIADTAVIGWVDLTDAGGTARRVAIV